MKAAAVTLIIIMLAVAVVAELHARPQNAGLPLVRAAAPTHGFVCVPSITPRIGPVRKQEII